ncbi:unnamed protein product [Kluyveromyces dobzhanskii CBS 2104]|uniref:WGS project CCBQ000000000 data, contig 00016 n=1 Tax=Kluyveromyces dobzhanskii CBS 2104 TaxID=1427455 RepID=A0A0A8L232_9SACH|nr:unnamed protein product [Kluyveromyces dobzhanskii CBS 2104]
MEEYVVEDSATIRSYFVTSSSKYVLYTRLGNCKSSKSCGEIVLFNIEEKKTTVLNVKITIPQSDLDFALNFVSLIDAPQILFNQERTKVTKLPWIVLNTGRSITTISFDELFTDEINSHEWHVDNNRDCITSFDCKADNNGNINVFFSTRLGNLYYIKFSTAFKKWCLVKRFDDFANDSLTCVSFGHSGQKNSQWEDRIGDIDNVLLSSLDNHLRFLVRQKGIEYSAENEILYSTFKVDNILTSADYQVVKSRSPKSFTSICCGNVTNLGCTVYKRTNRGEWIFLTFLEKPVDEKETVLTVNCQIVPGSQESEVVIYSGSENGKLYEWTLNWKEIIVIDKKTHTVGGEGDVISNLMCVNDFIYYLVNSERIGRIM